MSEASAKIRISLKDGEFELSGSELFVSQQITSFRELMVDSLKGQKFELRTPDNPESDYISPKLLPNSGNYTNAQQTSTPTNGNTGGKSAADYTNVFYVDDTTVKIIKTVSGGSYAEKAKRAAIIYLWAKQSIGINEVSFQEIRDVCKSLGCLDSNNFSGHLKSAKNEIIIDGLAGSSNQKCKLTIPGKEKAMSIISEMNN